MKDDEHTGEQVSVVDLFTIGIGPSSSHTVGPMRAGYRFARDLRDDEVTPGRVTCDLYGSLSLTGRGHATDRAVILGLAGETPEGIDPDAAEAILGRIRDEGALAFGGGPRVRFDEGVDIVWHKSFLPGHPNGMVFTAHLADGSTIARRFYSVGGGAIRMEGERTVRANRVLPHPYGSAAELLLVADAAGLSIADVVRANEAAWRDRSTAARGRAAIDRPAASATKSSSAADP